MGDTKAATPPPRKKRGFLKFLLWFFLILILLVVALFFVGTSSAFFKGVILPKISKALNAETTVSDASISPFKQVILKDVKVKPAGQETLLTAPEVRARYSLMDIIRGSIKVDELAISSPTISLVENPDGSKNIDPILKTMKENAKPEAPKKPSKPAKLDIKKIEVTGATIRSTRFYQGGKRDVSELSNLNLALTDLKNGQTAKLDLGADIKVENNPPTPKTNGTLEAKLKGGFTMALSSDLKPSAINGNTHIEITRASGAFAEAATLGTDLDCDVTPTEVKQVALRFSKGTTRLAEVRVAGPFDMEKKEGNLTAQIVSIDKQLLNIAGAASGLDFGSTVLNSTNDIQFAKGGSAITVSGEVALNKLQVTRTNQTTPTLDLVTRYNLTVDQNGSNAVIKELTINGTQKGNPLLNGQLTSPMPLSWGGAQSSVGDSTFNLTLTSLNLADWKPFLGDTVSAGTVNAKATILSQEAGKLLTFDVNEQLQNLAAMVGSNRISEVNATVVAKGRAMDLKKFDLNGYSLKLDHENQTVLTVEGVGTYDSEAQSADLQVSVASSLPQALKMFPQSDMELSAGKLDLKVQVVKRNDTVAVTGDMALADVTGKSGKTSIQAFQTTAKLDIAQTPQQIQIKRINGTLSESGKPGGSFDLSGTVNTNKAAQLTAKLVGFNENGLRPFLEPLLSDKKLVSVSINGTATTQYDPQGSSAIKADLQMTNLVVADEKSSAPSAPLEAKFGVDASIQKQIADVRQCAVILTPTDRAKNEVNLTGRMDVSNSTNMTGNLKLASDGLDLTRYYDLFAGEGKTEEPAKQGRKGSQRAGTSATSAPSQSPGPEKEPDAKRFPFSNFVANASISRVYLREVVVNDLQAQVKIDGGHVVLEPFKLALNGAPVNAGADIDMGVPGYKYNTLFGMQAVPLAPLVNTFSPDRKGQIGGTMTAQAKVVGQGITGASLQKNLSGNFDVMSTNLNLSVVNIKSPMLKALINVVAVIPDLLKGPENILGTLAKGFGSGSLTDQLKKSPIDAIVARAVVGSGKVDVQQAVVQSPAFRADVNNAAEAIRLADVLTNSPIQLPVTISLSRSIAQNFNLVGADTPTNAAYAALPSFYTMRGTIGDPKNDINGMALLKLGAKGVLGAVPVGGRVGNLLEKFTGGGNQPSAGTTGTNAQSAAPSSANTNAPTRSGGLLNDLLNSASRTNTTSTNKPATNQSPTRSLLNDLLQPKK